MTFPPRETADIIVFIVAAATATAITILIRRRRNRPSARPYDSLMKRAEAQADRSPFLKNMCRQYNANGHLSPRQIEQIVKALGRLETTGTN